MKYPYYIEYSKYGSPILQLPDEIEFVTLFLFCEVEDLLGRDAYLEEIGQVLRGEMPTFEVGGNVYALKVKKDFTTVVDTMAKYTNNPVSECVIETEELRHLIEVWLDLKRRISDTFQQRETEERHTDPAIAVPVRLLPRISSYTPIERKEEIMAVLC